MWGNRSPTKPSIWDYSTVTQSCSLFDVLLTMKWINGTNVSPRKALRVQRASHSIVLCTYEPIKAAAACWAQKPMKRFLAWFKTPWEINRWGNRAPTAAWLAPRTCWECWVFTPKGSHPSQRWGKGKYQEQHHPHSREGSPTTKQNVQRTEGWLSPSTLLLSDPSWNAAHSSGVPNTGRTWNWWSKSRGRHEVCKRTGAPPLRRQAGEFWAVQPGKDCVETSQHLPVSGGWQRSWRGTVHHELEWQDKWKWV